MTSHDKKWKSAKREEIAKLAKEYPIIAVATLEQLPANIMSLVRKRLNTDAKIVVAKTRVIKKAFEESGIDTKKLDPLVKESVAIIFSKKNPFELFSFIKKNKGEATAKEGDIAESDIIVQAGDTGLPPGPALSSLKAAGLKVAVQGPTISVTTDKVVTKKGEAVNKDVADVLSKLNMKPMKIGMNVLGVLEKETNDFYDSSVLDVDEEELFNNFIRAYQHALNLSVESEYFNDKSVELIVIKAARAAKAVNEATTSEEKESEVEKEAEEITEQSKELENKEEAKEENKVEAKEEGKVEAKEENKEKDTSENVLEKEAEEITEQTSSEEKKENK